ncbi:small ribosomal subunit protein uS15-like [Humulus lupulus]|uniref:small ribosomal subunit protein uS15-like n=1 Tax=Humulus lupulus TaxID=3486 RepID=UPI002B411042|nr:small ribosomal subunit protein uS15-like [Humulus lupulus]
MPPDAQRTQPDDESSGPYMSRLSSPDHSPRRTHSFSSSATYGVSEVTLASVSSIPASNIGFKSPPSLKSPLCLSSFSISRSLRFYKAHICKFAKKGLTPSQIGVILHDSHGIAQVKSVTGSKILRVLKAHGLAPEIPEDLYHLIKKAVSIKKHLKRNRKDKDSKFRFILVESQIHRLARYYKKTKKLPPVWK